MSDSVETVVTVVIVAIVSLVGIAVLAPVAGVVTDTAATDVDTSFSPLETTRFVVGDEETTITVRATRGNAVSMGGDGYVNATPPADWHRGNWSVAAVADPDTSDDSRFNPKATHNVVSADNETLRIDWDSGTWSVYYTDPASGDSALARVPATADRTPIVVTHNETADNVTIYADGSSDTAALTSTIKPRNASVNWVGVIDEVRYLNGTLTDSQRSAYQTDPITALPSATHTARWMFDAGSGDTARGFYAAPPARLVGAAWTANGVPGPGLDQGADYQLEADPIAVLVVDGGYLDGAPVAYVKAIGPLGQVLNAITGGVNSAFALVPVLLLAMMAMVIMATAQRLRNQP